VITGASRGIGYEIAKAMSSRIPGATLKLTTRGSANIEGLESQLHKDIGAASSRCVWRRLEMLDKRSIKGLQGAIKKKHGHINFMVNNAAVFYIRANSLADADFYLESKQLLGINYYGLKFAVDTFLPMMEDHSRIVNIGSHLGMIDCINGDEPAAGQLKKAFTDPSLTETELDELVRMFLESTKNGTVMKNGWPNCAYSVSKVAMNAYTGILQRRLDRERPEKNIVVNSVHTGAPHSKMKQGKECIIPREQGAAAVAYMATLGHSDRISDHLSRAAMEAAEDGPRGKVLWHDLRQIEWKADTVRPMAGEKMEGDKEGENVELIEQERAWEAVMSKENTDDSVVPIGEVNEGDTIRTKDEEKVGDVKSKDEEKSAAP